MGRRLDRHALLLGLDAQVGAGELGDVGQLGVDHLGVEVADVQVDVVPVRPGAAALADLGVDGPADHVARGQVLDGGGVALHERLAVGVAQDAALAPGRLRQQHPQPVQAGRVELEELHVLHGHAAPVADPGPVAGEGVGVGGDLEHLPEAAGAEHHRLGPEHVQLAGGQLVGDHPGRPAIDQQQVEHVVLVEEDGPLLDVLLEQGLEDHVAGAVGGEAGAAHGPLAVVVGVAAEAPLVDPAVGGAVERHAHVLEVVDGLDRLPAHDLGRVLVDQVVAALDGVEGVPLPVVLFDIRQGGAHAALGGAGVGAGRVELGDHRRPPPPGALQGGPQSGPPGPDDHHVEGVLLGHGGSYEGWGVKAKIVRVPRAQVRPTTVALTLW